MWLNNLMELATQYKQYQYPNNPVTRSVLRQCIRDMVDSLECYIVYRSLMIDFMD